MKIAEILHNSWLKQEELSAFTGIPRGRISMWLSKGKEPNKHDDVAIIQLTAKFFADKTPEQIKEAIANYKIEDGQVVAKNGVLHEPSVAYNKRSGKKDDPKHHEKMKEKEAGSLTKEQQQEESILNLSRANLILAESVKEIIEMLKTSNSSNKQAQRKAANSSNKQAQREAA